MENNLMAINVADNGGRRRVRDRRFLVSAPFNRDRRTYWERRSGFDRRLRRISEYPEDRRIAEKT